MIDLHVLCGEIQELFADTTKTSIEENYNFGKTKDVKGCRANNQDTNGKMSKNQ